MRLEKIKLRNYRCFKAEVELIVSDLNCLIGKNDIGKSTILEALDAFFNDNIDSGDLSTNASDKVIEITCYFSGIPSEIVLDTSSPTDPEEEGILNQENQLEIIRRFSIGSTVSKSTYLNCYHPINENLTDILSLKNDSLKTKAETLGVDLSDVTKSKNPPIRKAFREHFQGDWGMMELKVDGNLTTENNLKTIWGKLKLMLPVFTLFKVDKALDDKDKDVQDPMKSAVDETLAVPEIRELLVQIEEKVKEKSTQVADKIIEKLKDIDEALAEKLKSDFKKAPTWKSVFDLTLLNDQNIPLNKRGSGIRRLVLLSFFQAQAEKRKAEKSAPSIIYAIEEPETSQHPNHQLILIKSLVELSEQVNTQVLFTSHSANLVREIPIESLRYVSQNGDMISIEYGVDIATGEKDEATISNIVSALGILPNPADKIKVLVYVEGNHDVNGLKRYSFIINSHDPTLILLDREEIGWVITGGSSLKHYVENRYLEGLGKPEVHIYDSDVTDYVTIVSRINAEGNPNKKGFNTNKRELENYLHPDAINEAYNSQGNTCSITSIEDQDNIPLMVAKHLYSLTGGDWDSLEPDKRKEKSGSKKGFLNTIAVEKMSIDRITERGGYNEMKSWLEAISNYL